MVVDGSGTLTIVGEDATQGGVELQANQPGVFLAVPSTTPIDLKNGTLLLNANGDNADTRRSLVRL